MWSMRQEVRPAQQPRGGGGLQATSAAAPAQAVRRLLPEREMRAARADNRAPGARYSRHGKTRDGDPRYRCSVCGKTFSLGSPLRRQTRSADNGLVLGLLVNGMPLTKIAEITRLAPRDVYRKIDFIHGQVSDFVARREGMLESVDWEKNGTRFATDMQTLALNWPHKRTRAIVAVQHLCTAHARTGFIVAGSLQLDLDADPAAIEAAMVAAGDFAHPRSHRRYGRIWSASEFSAYLDAILRQRLLLLTPTTPGPGTQLPHVGVSSARTSFRTPTLSCSAASCEA